MFQTLPPPKEEPSLWLDVVKKSPEKPRGHMWLGLWYAEKGRYGEALRQFGIVVKLTRTQAWDQTDKLFHYSDLATMNAGVIYARLGRHSEAIQILEPLVNSSPSGLNIANLAGIYLTTGQNQKALDFLLHWNTKLPETGQILWALGEAYSSVSKCKEAEQFYSRAKNLDRELVPLTPCIEVLIGNPDPQQKQP